MPIDEGLLPDNFASNYGRRIDLKPDDNSRHCYTKLRCNFLKFKTHLFLLDHGVNLDSKHEPHKRLPALSLFLFYIYCTVKMSVAAYYHYVLDYHRYKLDKFDQLLYYYKDDNHQLTSVQIRHREEIREQLVHEYEDTRQVLKRIGAPYLNFSFIAGMAKLALLLAISVTYLMPVVYYRFWRPFDYSIIYTLIEPERLQEATETIIREQVNKFIISCRTYFDQYIDQETSEAVLLQWQKELLEREFKSNGHKDDHKYEGYETEDEYDDNYFGVARANSLTIRAVVTRIVDNHKFLVQQVKSMATEGMLQPFNRRREWLVNLSLLHSLSELVFLSIASAWLIYMMLVLPFTDLLSYKLEKDPLDIIFHMEHCLYGIIGVSADVFHLSLTAITCLDQVHIVSILNNLIKNTILDSTRKLKDFLEDEFRVYRSPFSERKFSLDEFTQTTVLRSPIRKIHFVPTHSAPKGSTTLSSQDEFDNSLMRLDRSYIDPYIERSINVSLMHTLMHYKIFVTQLKPALDSLPVFATFVLLLTFSYPAITRLLIAYLDTKRKGASLIFCILILIGSDMVFVMVDRLHARCMTTYRCLQSLMAHIVSMDHIVKLQTGREAYDKHLVSILRKELSHPERLTGQFATHLILSQSTMTYASLIKYHFWWGVLTISIIMIDQSLPNASDIFGGVWRYYGFADEHLNSLLYPQKGNNTIA